MGGKMEALLSICSPGSLGGGNNNNNDNKNNNSGFGGEIDNSTPGLRTSRAPSNHGGGTMKVCRCC